MSKKVAIGELKQIGTLEKNVPIVVGAGYKDSYSDVYITVTKGRLIKKKGTKVLENGQAVFITWWEWVCRFELAIEADIKKNHRWRIGDNIYMIEDYELMEEKKHWYLFTLSKAE